jgi:hypothetical protein
METVVTPFSLFQYLIMRFRPFASVSHSDWSFFLLCLLRIKSIEAVTVKASDFILSNDVF